MKRTDAQVETIQQLQRQILAMQGYSRPPGAERVSTGLGAIERAFPNHTFPTGAIHEFTSSAPADSAATNGFLAGLMSRLTSSAGICLWVSTRRSIFPPALKTFGIEPERVVFIDVAREKEALWTVEEALKCKALYAVVGELGNLDFTASRRLQLAVEESSVTGFIHRYRPKTETAVACVARWKITSLASVQEADAPGLGFPRWNVQLAKVRNGVPGAWQVEWTPEGFRQLPAFSPSLSRSGLRKTG